MVENELTLRKPFSAQMTSIDWFEESSTLHGSPHTNSSAKRRGHVIGVSGASDPRNGDVIGLPQVTRAGPAVGGQDPMVGRTKQASPFGRDAHNFLWP